MDEFREQHSGVELQYVEGGLSEQILAVQQHKVDVAFVIGPIDLPDCDVVELWRERVCVAMAAVDPLAKKEEVERGGLRERRFVVTDTARGQEG